MDSEEKKNLSSLCLGLEKEARRSQAVSQITMCHN
jgi:hypothetical protein